jgi:hypothetical protein
LLSRYGARFAKDFTISRTRSMKSRATGLGVRLFKVMIPTGQVVTDKSTGRTFSGGRFLPNRNNESGMIDTKGSVTNKAQNRSGVPNAAPFGGNFKPRERNVLATSEPKGPSRNDKHAVVKQDFCGNIVVNRASQSTEDEFHVSLTQFAVSLRDRRQRGHMNGDSWILAAEPTKHCGDQSANDGLVGSNPNFANGRIGKKLDVLHRLAQVVEDRQSAVEQSSTVLGWFDALAVAFEQADTNGMFQFRDRPRNGGLPGVQERGCLGHAARLHDGHQDVKVVQLQLASDTIAQLHG